MTAPHVSQIAFATHSLLLPPSFYTIKPRPPETKKYGRGISFADNKTRKTHLYLKVFNVTIFFNFMEDTRRCFNIYKTSIRRQGNSYRRLLDVEPTCVYWVNYKREY